MKRWMSRILLPAVIVVMGGVGAKGLMSMKAKASRRPVSETATTVETFTVTASASHAQVVGNGVITPDREVIIQPEVNGRITWVSQSLVPGSRISAGTTIGRIDPRQYELAIKQEESRVRKAELELELEGGRQRIAAREWKLLGESDPDRAPDLALRKPQLAVAKYNLDAAKSGLERAKLNLERTYLKAPFNAVVLEEWVDVGQVVGPATKVARLIGADTARVVVSLPVERLALIDIPDVNAKRGSPATIVQALGGRGTIERRGYVRRLQGQLDPKTRTAQLLVTVEDPYGAGEDPPLLAGAYVSVAIQGKPIEGLFAVPREALSRGDTVWVVEDGKLDRRKVELRWGNVNQAFVGGDLRDGDQLVVTQLSLPIDGMPVRVKR